MTLRFVPVTDNPGIVEVHDDQKLVAAIYAHEDNVALVSKYYTETLVDTDYPPKVTVVLKGADPARASESTPASEEPGPGSHGDAPRQGRT